jgi:hypothetical protein
VIDPPRPPEALPTEPARRRPPPRTPRTRPQTGRIVALLAVVFVLGVLVGRLLFNPPATPPPVVATQNVSLVTVTEGAETVTVTK